MCYSLRERSHETARGLKKINGKSRNCDVVLRVSGVCPTFWFAQLQFNWEDAGIESANGYDEQ